MGWINASAQDIIITKEGQQISAKVIVIENGKETITETGYNGHENPEPVVKVELHKKKLNDVVVNFK